MIGYKETPPKKGRLLIVYTADFRYCDRTSNSRQQYADAWCRNKYGNTIKRPTKSREDSKKLHGYIFNKRIVLEGKFRNRFITPVVRNNSSVVGCRMTLPVESTGRVCSQTWLSRKHLFHLVFTLAITRMFLAWIFLFRFRIFITRIIGSAFYLIELQDGQFHKASNRAWNVTH